MTNNLPKEEYFYQQILINPNTPLINGSHCEEWTGSINNAGYGTCNIFKDEFKTNMTHRIAYLLSYGLIKNMVLHECVGNRKCCNVHHLYDGTAKQNVEDMMAQNRHGSLNPNKDPELIKEEYRRRVESIKKTKEEAKKNRDMQDIKIDALTQFLCASAIVDENGNIIMEWTTELVKQYLEEQDYTMPDPIKRSRGRPKKEWAPSKKS